MANLCIKLNLCFFFLLEAKELACKDNLANDDTASKGDPFVTVHLKSRYGIIDIHLVLLLNLFRIFSCLRKYAVALGITASAQFQIVSKLCVALRVCE